jgi:hypothetical protein
MKSIAAALKPVHSKDAWRTRPDVRPTEWLIGATGLSTWRGQNHSCHWTGVLTTQERASANELMHASCWVKTHTTIPYYVLPAAQPMHHAVSAELAVTPAICPLLALDSDDDAAGATVVPGAASAASASADENKLLDMVHCRPPSSSVMHICYLQHALGTLLPAVSPDTACGCMTYYNKAIAICAGRTCAR